MSTVTSIMNSSFTICNSTGTSLPLTRPEIIILNLVLIIVDIIIIIGNSFVIVAVMTQKKLRVPTNMLVLSLACADLALGVFVLPYAIMNDVLGRWVLGRAWCGLWLAVDVWLCTSSITHLCAISLDRYLGVTRPLRYLTIMTKKRMKLMAGAAWVFSFVICCPPLFGWNVRGLHTTANSSPLNSTSLWSNDVTTHSSEEALATGNIPATPRTLWQTWTFLQPYQVEDVDSCQENVPLCELTLDKGYVVYSVLGSFYLPCVLMFVFYSRIFTSVRRVTTSVRRGRKVIVTKSPDSNKKEKDYLRIHLGGSSNVLSNTENTSRSQSPLLDKRKVLVPPTSLEKLTPTINTSVEYNLNKMQATSCVCLRTEQRRPSVRSRLSTDGVRNMKSGSRGSHIHLNVPLLTNTQPCPEQSQLSQSSFNLSEGNSHRQRSSSFSTSPSPHSSITFHFTKTKRSPTNRGLKSSLIKETKAAKTLSIVIGAFVLCWMPFFIVYPLEAIFGHISPPLLLSITEFLGYCNSALNPLIYALFSRDFRWAFHRLLTCHKGNSGVNCCNR